MYLGCTDSKAANYDPSANEEDLSCQQLVPGCTNPTALNYHVVYTVNDGSCIILGCIDPASASYNPEATISIPCSRRRQAALPSVTTARHNLTASRRDLGAPGCCPMPSATNYRSGCTNPCEPSFECCEFLARGCRLPSALNYVPTAEAEYVPSTCVEAVDGCVVPHNTLNYASEANRYQGCVFAFRGCTDPHASTFHPTANLHTSAMCRYESFGCANPEAVNYESTATVSTGCIFRRVGCGDRLAINFVPDVNFPMPSECKYASYGCTLPQAINFDPSANVDDGSCTLFRAEVLGLSKGEAAAQKPAEVVLLGSGAAAALLLLFSPFGIYWLRRAASKVRRTDIPNPLAPALPAQSRAVFGQRR